ncbi:MAG: hypothetical protein AAF213_04090 [Pseudomonadota bacterium]
MAVIDLYTRRILGPREIRERAEYQPQALGEDWSFADDMVDHDLARLLDQQRDHDDPTTEEIAGQPWRGHLGSSEQPAQGAPSRYDGDNTVDNTVNNTVSDTQDDSAVERYARWMAIGHERHHQTADFTPDHPPGHWRSRLTRPTSEPAQPDRKTQQEREQLYRDIERAKLTQTADDLRGAAQRLRDLASNLRATRDRLYQQNQRYRDHNQQPPKRDPSA